MPKPPTAGARVEPVIKHYKWINQPRAWRQVDDTGPLSVLEWSITGMDTLDICILDVDVLFLRSDLLPSSLLKESLVCACISCFVSDSLWPHGQYTARFLCPWNSPGKNTGVGCHALLQGIFPTHGSNPGLLLSGRFFTIWATRKGQGKPYSRSCSSTQHGFLPRQTKLENELMQLCFFTSWVWLLTGIILFTFWLLCRYKVTVYWNLFRFL